MPRTTGIRSVVRCSSPISRVLRWKPICRALRSVTPTKTSCRSLTDLTGVANRFFDGKTAKKSTNVSGFRDQFPNHAGNLREPTNLGFDDKGIPERTYTPDDKTHFVPKKGEQQPAKTVAEALGLGDEAANGRGHEEPVRQPSQQVDLPHRCPAGTTGVWLPASVRSRRMYRVRTR